jgi:hypothetical protein
MSAQDDTSPVVTYSLICKHTGQVTGQVTTLPSAVGMYETEDTEVVEGKHCFRTSYRDPDGEICERVRAEIFADKILAVPGDIITITKPDDCMLRVDDRISDECVFVAGKRDFRAVCLGRYSGEVHVAVRSEAQIREAALKAAMERAFRDSPDGQAILKASIGDLSADAQKHL